MLVLTRKIDEGIAIGDNIMLTVNVINGNRVIVGIDAPIEIKIKRGELAAKKNAVHSKKTIPINH